MSVRIKLALSYLSIIVLFAGLAAYIVYTERTVIRQMGSLDADFEQTAVQSQQLDATFHLLLTLQESRLTLHELLLDETEAATEFIASIETFDQHLAELRAVFNGHVDDDSVAALATLDAVAEAHEHFHEDAQQILVWAATGEQEKAIQLLNDELEAELIIMEQQIASFEMDSDQKLLAADAHFDAKVHEVEDGITQLRIVTIALIILSVLAAIGLSSWLTQLITRPVNDLSETAVSIEQGTFELQRLPQLTDRRDEFGLLARVFQRMAEEIHAREQALKQQVRQLQIKIDRTKHDQQVAEITETDFFQQLEAKAAGMRRSRSNPDTQAE